MMKQDQKAAGITPEEALRISTAAIRALKERLSTANKVIDALVADNKRAEAEVAKLRKIVLIQAEDATFN